MKKWITLASLVVVGTLLALVITCSFVFPNYRTTVEEVEAEVTANLPRGSTTEQITRYLDSNEIYHEAPVRAGMHFRLTELGIREDAMVIRAFIPETGYADLVTTRNIGIYFVLDDQSSLDDVVVIEELTGS